MSGQKVPISYTTLKQTLRDGLKFREARAYWWPMLPALHKYVKGASASEEITGGTIEEHPDFIEIAEQLHVVHGDPLLDHVSMSKYQPTEETAMIEAVTKNLVYFLKHKKGVDAGFLNAIIRIIIKEMQRIDVAFLIVNDLLEKRQKYMEPSYEGLFIMNYTFKEMVSEYMPLTYSSLSRIGALDDGYLNMMFLEFFVELLPEQQVLRMFDCYLNEGVKVLYRYGLALIKGYKDFIKADKYETAKDFWISVKADAIAVSSTFDMPLLFKVIGTEENLPAVDPFLVYSSSKNKQFMSDNTITSFAFEEDRSGFAKMARPMPISKSNLDALRTAAAAKFLTSNPIGSPHNSPLKAGGGNSPAQKSASSVFRADPGTVRRSSVQSQIVQKNANQKGDGKPSP